MAFCEEQLDLELDHLALDNIQPYMFEPEAAPTKSKETSETLALDLDLDSDSDTESELANKVPPAW